jgi:hypothetical protein
MKRQPRTHQHETRHPALVVELSRANSDEQFTCTLPDWNFILQLGQTFGWHPTGATYLPQQGQRARHNPIKHDYQPGESQDSKHVEADDSAQWTAALDGAKRSPFIAGMLRRHAELHMSTEHSLHSQLQTFVEFARRGAFTIALRDMR